MVCAFVNRAVGNKVVKDRLIATLTRAGACL